MRYKSALILMLMIVLLTACGGGETSEFGDVRKGKQIFETGGDSGVPCLTCHTRDGSELVGPSLLGIRDRAGTRVPGLSAEDYIRQSIREPSTYVVDGYEDQMDQAFGETFTDEDINNIIAYLYSLE